MDHLRERNWWAQAMGFGDIAGQIIDSAVLLGLAFGSLDFLAGKVFGNKWTICRRSWRLALGNVPASLGTPPSTALNSRAADVVEVTANRARGTAVRLLCRIRGGRISAANSQCNEEVDCERHFFLFKPPITRRSKSASYVRTRSAARHGSRDDGASRHCSTGLGE